MVLGVAFWISLLLSILKIFEIALSQKQQKRVQDCIENLTLRLSYINLSTLFSSLRKTKIQLSLAVLTLILAYVVTALFVVKRGHLKAVMLSGTFLRLAAFQIPLVLLIFPVELRWLTRAGTISSFFKKAGTILVLMVVLPIVAAFFDLDIFLDAYPKIRLFILLPFVIPFSVCLYASVYVLLIKVAQASIWLSTKILWRVVEYPKGAWAAVLFVITGLLGVAQVLLTRKH